jgi:hypothetical protein
MLLLLNIGSRQYGNHQAKGRKKQKTKAMQSGKRTGFEIILQQTA